MKDKNVRVYKHISEGYWGQSVSEFALGLTLSALRRIPQTHHHILTDLRDWGITPPPEEQNINGLRGIQFGDDERFVNGTLAGKRVCIVGAGNIASRYASFASALGADVVAWGPIRFRTLFSSCQQQKRMAFGSPHFRCGEFFAPLIPLTPQTRHLINASHIDRLPRGTLVVLATAR